MGHSERTCTETVQWDIQNVYVLRLSSGTFRTCNDTSKRWTLGTRLYTVEISDRSSGVFRTGLCTLSKPQTGLHWSSGVFRTVLCTLSKPQTGLHWSSGVFRTGLCTLSKSQTGLHWSSGVFRTGLCTLSKSRIGLVGYTERAIVPCQNLRLA